MNNIPAFPTGTGWNHEGNWVGGGDDGMTLRDYFAAKAMQTMLQGSGTFESHAEYAYKMADKMMEARK